MQLFLPKQDAGCTAEEKSLSELGGQNQRTPSDQPATCLAELRFSANTDSVCEKYQKKR